MRRMREFSGKIGVMELNSPNCDEAIRLARRLLEEQLNAPFYFGEPCKATFEDLPCTYFEDRSADAILDAEIIE